MSKKKSPPSTETPGLADHAVSALNAWIGDELAETGNELHEPMAFMVGNRKRPPESLPASSRVAVWVHGLGCNEAMWQRPETESVLPFGATLHTDFGYLPLYIRYNTGQRISTNGAQLNRLLQAYVDSHPKLEELLLIGHSMGGLVIRSASHLAQSSGWPQRVQHIFYLGSPHLGAPLERSANVASHLLSALPTTATQVIGEVLNTRSEGVKDLRYGNLSDADWLNLDPDALLDNRRVPIPWLPSARHHRVVGELISGLEGLGDAVVPSESARATRRGEEPEAPGPADLQVLPGLHHLALAQAPQAYAALASRLSEPAHPPDALPNEAPNRADGPESRQRRWHRARGLTRLIHHGVDRTTSFVERHHRRAADTPFRVLEQVEGVAAPAGVVEEVYLGIVGASYEGVRSVNKLVEAVDTRILDLLAAHGSEE